MPKRDVFLITEQCHSMKKTLMEALKLKYTIKEAIKEVNQND